ncbi:MAG: hypothetical protein GQ527_05475, partial [Bacteroidales bacterium]|nr:hypothetical protein [Bacteroidales bacterium]
MQVTTSYRRYAHDGACNTTFEVSAGTWLVTVYDEFTVGSITADQSISYNNTPVELTGTPPNGGNTPYTYQWQVSTDNTTFSDISGATNINYQPSTLFETTYYRQKQTSSSGCAYHITNVLTITVDLYGAPNLWGMTSIGGANEVGAIYTTDINGNNYTIQESFSVDDGRFPFHSKLCEASNGKLYGVTVGGGLLDEGILFEFDPASDTYTEIIEFDAAITGSYPYGFLMLATNGKMYGMTSEGGTSDMGVLYEFDPISSAYTKRIDFDGLSNGSYPYGSLFQADNGNVYGMTSEGGTSDLGVLFEFNIGTAALTKKIDFDGVAKGSLPLGSLFQANNGLLYGMTKEGGTLDMGVLFEFDPASDTYTKKIDFTGLLNGSYPEGDLMQASNNMIYGMSEDGGVNDLGILFSYDLGTGLISKIIDFDGAANGSHPMGSLIQAINGLFYGLTGDGGTDNFGTLFEFNPIGNIYTKKIDFDGFDAGYYPLSTLYQASNGNLYGTSSFGGSLECGVLFEYIIASSSLIKKVDFYSTPCGGFPCSSLLYASDDLFYGMTPAGGASDIGIIFKYNQASGAYSVIKEFVDPENGDEPNSSLIEVSNGLFYGVTTYGGTSDMGVLFEFNPSTGVYTKKIDFEGATNGSYPIGKLLEASNGLLYGMTATGGTSNMGVIYEYNTATGIITIKVSLDATLGNFPYGALIEASNGKLYGLTSQGGTSNKGVLFDYDIAGNIYTKKIDLDGASKGSFSFSSLFQASNGLLYGLTSSGGTSDMGVLFEYDIMSNTYTKKFDFTGAANGDQPLGSLMESTNGKLYGMTYYGGTSDLGVLFEYDITNDILTKKLDFDGTNGGNNEYGHLIEIAPCLNPTSGGSIASNQSGCYNFDPNELTSISPASGESGSLEYKWQKSTTNSTSGFSDIASTNATSYNPSNLNQTTWYKRLARVDCEVNWTGAMESNVIEITVYDEFVIGSIAADQSICYNTTPAELTGTAPTGGNTAYSYQWQISTDNINFSDIATATGIDY